jgi:excisionase family DNA binding protein
VDGKVFTTKEAAEELGLSVRAVQKMIESGRLKADRVGRDYLITPESLENIERKSKAGRPPNKLTELKQISLRNVN